MKRNLIYILIALTTAAGIAYCIYISMNTEISYIPLIILGILVSVTAWLLIDKVSTQKEFRMLYAGLAGVIFLFLMNWGTVSPISVWWYVVLTAGIFLFFLGKTFTLPRVVFLSSIAIGTVLCAFPVSIITLPLLFFFALTVQAFRDKDRQSGLYMSALSVTLLLSWLFIFQQLVYKGDTTTVFFLALNLTAVALIIILISIIARGKEYIKNEMIATLPAFTIICGWLLYSKTARQAVEKSVQEIGFIGFKNVLTQLHTFLQTFYIAEIVIILLLIIGSIYTWKKHTEIVILLTVCLLTYVFIPVNTLNITLIALVSTLLSINGIIYLVHRKYHLK